MTALDLLRIFAAMIAPAFFLLFGLAALGAPMLAVVCQLASLARRTQSHEAYARRLLRMALTCALVALLALAGTLALAHMRLSWLADWLLSAPLAPALFATLALAYAVSLLVRRLSDSPRRHHDRERILQPVILAALAVGVLHLLLVLAADLAAQAQAVLAAPAEGGVCVAALVHANLLAPGARQLLGLLACIPLAALCAGAWSQEYLLLRREREPFGSEAFAHAQRLAARCSLRAALLALPFVALYWGGFSGTPGTAPADDAPQPLLAAAAAQLLLAAVLWALQARSHRPERHPWRIHTALLLAWSALSALLAAALLHVYGL